VVCSCVGEEISLSRPNWSRPLPRLLVIPDVMQLRTLADVRALIERHLPAHCRAKATWRIVAKLAPTPRRFRLRCGWRF
jgi:hypothetical protein